MKKLWVLLLMIILLIPSTAYAESINLEDEYAAGNITITADWSWNNNSTEVPYGTEIPEPFGENGIYTITYEPTGEVLETGGAVQDWDFSFTFTTPKHVSSNPSKMTVSGFGNYSGTLTSDKFESFTIIPVDVYAELLPATKIEGEDDPDEAAWTYDESGWHYDPSKDYQAEFTSDYNLTEQEKGNIVWMAYREEYDEEPGTYDVYFDIDEGVQGDFNIIKKAEYGTLTILSAFCNIIYEDGFGTELYNENVERNAATPIIDNPTKEEYNFLGWNPAIADFVTEDAKYIATWEKIIMPEPEPTVEPEPEPVEPAIGPEPEPEPTIDPVEPEKETPIEKEKVIEQSAADQVQPVTEVVPAILPVAGDSPHFFLLLGFIIGLFLICLKIFLTTNNN